MADPIVTPTLAASAAAGATATVATASGAGAVATRAAIAGLALQPPSAATAGLAEALRTVVNPMVKSSVRIAAQTLTNEVFSDSPELRALASLAFRLGAVEAPVLKSPLAVEVTDVPAWIEGKSLATRSVFHPLDLVQRWRELRAFAPQIAAHLATHDEQFRTRLEAAGARLAEAIGPGDLDSYHRYLEVSVAPLLAEKLVECALRPFFEQVTGQVRVAIGDSYSVVDLLCEGARKPIIVERGFKIDVGQSLAVEIKARREDGLLQSLRELRSVQVPAHLLRADHSMVVMTGDVGDIARLEQTSLRDAVRAEGSRIMKVLPHKQVLVETCEVLLRRGAR